MIAKETRVPVRHIFELFDIQKSDPVSVNFAAIGTTEVQLRPHREPAELATKLHAWSLGILTAGYFELGLYSACCMSLDGNDSIIDTLGSIYLAWDGRAELAYGTW